MTTAKNNTRASRASQQGAVMIVSLLILLVMTVIGSTAIRTTTLEEKMVGNMYDHGRAFQAAESALRAAEREIQAFSANELEGNFGALDGQYGANDLPPTLTQVYSDSSFWGNQKSHGGNSSYYIRIISLDSVNQAPTFNARGYANALASLSGATGVFEITARGTGGTTDSQVVLRSNYARSPN